MQAVDNYLHVFFSQSVTRRAGVKMIRTVVVFFALGVLVQAEQNWYSFKTTWSVTPFDGFIDQPRTEAEAKAQGWLLVSNDCSPEAKYVQNRINPFSTYLCTECTLHPTIRAQQNVFGKTHMEVRSPQLYASFWYLLH